MSEIYKTFLENVKQKSKYKENFYDSTILNDTGNISNKIDIYEVKKDFLNCACILREKETISPIDYSNLESIDIKTSKNYLSYIVIDDGENTIDNLMIKSFENYELAKEYFIELKEILTNNDFDSLISIFNNFLLK